MNEIKKVHLGRVSFTISIEAHKALRDYLAAIEKQPGIHPEVSKEIEMRMAELLTERGIGGEKVVLEEDVDYLKGQLGEPRDFKDEDGETHEGKAEKPHSELPKKLFRDTQQGMIAGVASGLAAYLNLDVIIIRIVFIALSFASGAGIILYILIWLLAPEAKTNSDRLQMRGKPITVDSIKEFVERADVRGAGERAGSTLGRGFRGVFKVFVTVVLTLVGMGFLLAGVGMMLGSITTGIYMLLHGGQLGNEILFPLGAREVWFVILGLVATVIIGFFVFLIGLAMMCRRWRMPGWAVATLLGILLVSASVGTALGFDIYPAVQQRFKAAQHTQVSQMPEFKQLMLEGDETSYQFEPSNEYKVKVDYFGNMDTHKLTKAVESGVLRINTDAFIEEASCSGICPFGEGNIRVTIYAPTVDKIALTGSENNLTIDNQLQQDNLIVEVPRAGLQYLNLAHMHPAALELTDSRGANKRSLVLTGLARNASKDATIVADEESVTVNRVNHLTLNSPDSCDISDPFLQLVNMPEQLTVDQKTVLNKAEFEVQRSPDALKPFNCVTVY